MQHAREEEAPSVSKCLPNQSFHWANCFANRADYGRVQTLKPFRMAVRAKKLSISKIDNQMLKFWTRDSE